MKINAAWCTILLALVVTTGCETFSGTQPPNVVEQRLFNTETNYVDEIVQRAAEVKTTNTLGTISTNVITVLETNAVPVYTHTVKDDVKAETEIIGGVTNLFAPGTGGLVAGLLGGALGVWARMRSHKKTGTVLAQNIQTILEFVRKSVPNGDQQVKVLKDWLKDNQQETGTLNDVLTLLNKYVKNKDAKNAATEIQNLIKQLEQESA